MKTPKDLQKIFQANVAKADLPRLENSKITCNSRGGIIYFLVKEISYTGCECCQPDVNQAWDDTGPLITG